MDLRYFQYLVNVNDYYMARGQNNSNPMQHLQILHFQKLYSVIVQLYQIVSSKQ